MPRLPRKRTLRSPQCLVSTSGERWTWVSYKTGRFCRLLFLLHTVYQHVYTTEEERVFREADDQRRRPAEGISKDPSDCQALCQREGIEVPRHCKLATSYP
jgi:hypothetical protein